MILLKEKTMKNYNHKNKETWRTCFLLFGLLMLNLLFGCSTRGTTTKNIHQQLIPSETILVNPTVETTEMSVTMTPAISELPKDRFFQEPFLIFTDLHGIYTINIQTSEFKVIKEANIIDLPETVDDQIYFLYSKGDISGFEPAKIFRINSDGTNEEQLTFGKSFEMGYSISPDKKYLVFLSDNINIKDRYSISVMDLSTKKTRIIANNSKNAYSSQSWSPDSKKIAFMKTGNFDNDNEAIIYDINSGNTSKLSLNDISLLCVISWTQDGNNIALSLKDKENYGFFLYNLSTNLLTKLYSFEEEPFGISWSKDEQRILYETSYENLQKERLIRLHLVDLRINDQKVIEDNSVMGGYSHQARWLSDDNYFAYDERLENNQWEIIIIDYLDMNKYIVKLPDPYNLYPKIWIIN